MILRLIPVLFLALSLFACSEPPTESQLIEQAREYQDQGDPQAAIISLKNLLQRNPENSEARWLLGKLYVDTGRGAFAEKELKRAQELGLLPGGVFRPLARAYLLQNKPDEVLAMDIPRGISSTDRARFFAFRGDAQVIQGKLVEAGAQYETALVSHEDLPEALTGQARIAFFRGQLNIAREKLEYCLNKSPGYGRALELLADIDVAEGKLDQALEHYSQAIDALTNEQGARFKRALVHVKKGDLDQAKVETAYLKRHFRGLPGTWYALGVLALAEGDVNRAQTGFSAALKLKPDYGPAMLFQGFAHYRQGNLTSAERSVASFLKANRNSAQGRLLLAVIRWKMKDYAHIESVLIPYLRQVPDDKLALTIMGNTYLILGKQKSGIRFLERVAELDPGSSEARFRLGLGLISSGALPDGFLNLETAVNMPESGGAMQRKLALAYIKTGKFDDALKVAEKIRSGEKGSARSWGLTGIAYMGKGDMDAAKSAFRKAVEVSPGDPNGAMNLAQFAWRDGDLEKAEYWYNEILKHHPDHLRASYRLADLERETGRAGEAEERLKRLLQANPNDIKTKVKLARIFLEQGKPSRVMAMLGDLQKEHPDDYALSAVVGEAQLAMGQPDNALFSFKKLIRIQPRSGHAYYLLARAYADKNDADGMRQALEKAAELNPDDPKTRLANVRYLLLEGKIAAARSALGLLKTSFPDHMQIILLEGEIELADKHYPQAIEYFSKAATQYPSTRTNVRLATAQVASGDITAAVSTLEKWLELHPESVAAHSLLAELRLQEGDRSGAIEALESTLALAPDHVIALNNLAWELRNSDRDRASSLASRALDLAPRSPQVRDTMGMLLLGSGKTERAVRMLRSAAEAAPAVPLFQIHLAEALAKNGAVPGARRVLEKLLAGDHDFPERQRALDLLGTLP